MANLNPGPIMSAAARAAYVDALIDDTFGNNRGARSAFIRYGLAFTESDWPEYRRMYERRMEQMRKSHAALNKLRMAGAL